MEEVNKILVILSLHEDDLYLVGEAKVHECK